MLKTLLKSFVVVLAVLAGTGVAIAASTNDDPSIPTMEVTDASQVNTSWGSSVNIEAGEKLAFFLHYYLEEGESASDMRFSIENLNGKSFSAGDTKTVTGKVTADNLSTANGSTIVNFADDVDLSIYNVSWQKYPCSSVGCETALVDSATSVLTSNGMTIGNVSGNDDHYTGSVVIEFLAKASNGPVDPEPADDVNVQTDSATSVDEDSARLNGEVTEGDNVSVWFAFDDSSSVSCTDSSDRVSVSGTYDDGDDFSYNVSNLDDNTTYYYRACAENDDNDVVSGNRLSFTTDNEDNSSNDDIEVETENEDDVDEDSAVLNGSVNEGDDISVWFVLDDESDVRCSDNGSRYTVTGSYDDGDEFDRRVTGLDDDETYYYRACGEDQDGNESEGDRESFRTGSDNNNTDGDVSTLTPTDLDSDSAELRGRVEEGDNQTVWFAFSRTSSAPSCNSSSQRISVSGTYDDGDVFERTASGLQSGTTYYYRACVEDDNNNIVSGSVRSFRTDGSTTVVNVDSDPVAITGLPSGITTTSARFNATVVGDGNATCYFEYGRTSAFGLTTAQTVVNLDNTSSCSSTRFGLNPGTNYFYRSVLVQNGETFRGLTRSFQTNSVVVTTPRVVVPATPGTPQLPVVENNGGLEITKWVSAETDPEFEEFTDAKRGEAVFYRVRIENNTNETITDIDLVDQIPFYLELDGQRSLDDDADKQVTWFIDSLRPDRSRTFITEMRVREDAITGDQIFSFATATYDDEVVNSNDVVIEVESGSIEDLVVDGEEIDGQSASIFGAGFLPTSLFGWMLLIIGILIIAFLLSRILFTRTENKRILEELKTINK